MTEPPGVCYCLVHFVLCVRSNGQGDGDFCVCSHRLHGSQSKHLRQWNSKWDLGNSESKYDTISKKQEARSKHNKHTYTPKQTQTNKHTRIICTYRSTLPWIRPWIKVSFVNSFHVSVALHRMCCRGVSWVVQTDVNCFAQFAAFWCGRTTKEQSFVVHTMTPRHLYFLALPPYKVFIFQLDVLCVAHPVDIKSSDGCAIICIVMLPLGYSGNVSCWGMTNCRVAVGGILTMFWSSDVVDDEWEGEINAVSIWGGGTSMSAGAIWAVTFVNVARPEWEEGDGMSREWNDLKKNVWAWIRFKDDEMHSHRTYNCRIMIISSGPYLWQPHPSQNFGLTEGSNKRHPSTSPFWWRLWQAPAPNIEVRGRMIERN